MAHGSRFWANDIGEEVNGIGELLEAGYTPNKENFRCHCPLPDVDFSQPG
jgi:hypothetical protein